MANNDLHKLFIDQLQDIYDAEHRIIEALPKKIEAAENPQLKQALESHLAETREQVARLEKVFQSIDAPAKRNKCEATVGLIEEAGELLEEFKGTSANDAAIICAAQKIEHYEVATYGSLCSWASEMGHGEALQLLQETLAEEKSADKKLTEVAETVANAQAR